MPISENGALKTEAGQIFIEWRPDERETETLADREHNYNENELIEIRMFNTARKLCSSVLLAQQRRVGRLPFFLQ